MQLPTDDWPTWIARARRLESLGFHHLWMPDHLSWREYAGRPWLSALPLLTATAAATSRIRLGTMVASPSFRHPVPFAHELMTLDQISAGRFILGIGAGAMGGWDESALGRPAWPAAERVGRFGEFLSTLDTLLTQPETTFSGTYYSASQVRIVPGCVQKPRIPFAIAATGRKALALAARHADAWVTTGGGKDFAQWRLNIASQWRIIEDECGKINRDPSTIDKIFTAGFIPEHVTASLTAFTDFTGELTEAGFTDTIFHYPRPDDDRWNDPVEVVDQIAAHFHLAPDSGEPPSRHPRM
ncbi:LLM class flavin-dependent oxidoreductase [Fodinicola feengrottensis]|uniref:LLM class flavin-dependent oxidoreductase n=2 Tax=Fodinicola feengrottensis TaxID=435914 RepID=A0ABN2GTB8_9ACTN